MQVACLARRLAEMHSLPLHPSIQQHSVFSVGASPAADNCIPAGGSGYDRNERSCVSGANIRRIADQSVPECAALCDAVDACVGFEYGVAYGGSSTSYGPRDCQLSSSADMAGCDGSLYNLDFYTPLSGCPCSPSLLPSISTCICSFTPFLRCCACRDFEKCQSML